MKSEAVFRREFRESMYKVRNQFHFRGDVTRGNFSAENFKLFIITGMDFGINDYKNIWQ